MTNKNNESTQRCIDNSVDFLLHLLTQQADELKTALPELLETSFGYEIERGEDFIFATPKAGALPIALCAHMDVVGVLSPTMEQIVVSDSQRVIALAPQTNLVGQPQVLGGDDRAGIFAVLNIVADRFNKKLPLPVVIFTDKEEIGGVGADELCQSGLLGEFNAKINLFIEFDRKGSNEIVTYSGENPEKLANLAESYGFIYDFGSYSDVADFTDTTGTANLNVSCGFYHAHTRSEVIHFDELQLSILRVTDMLNDSHIVDTTWVQEDSFDEFEQNQNQNQRDCCADDIDADMLYEFITEWIRAGYLVDYQQMYLEIYAEGLELAIPLLAKGLWDTDPCYECVLGLLPLYEQDNQEI